MIKSGPFCHLTCNDVDLPKTTYLREHPRFEEHGVKPLRIHCGTCSNQLGVMIWSNGNLKPSFTQYAVIFKNADGSQLLCTQWKNKYARVHNVVPIENIGSSTHFDVEAPQFYILDHKAWEFCKNGELRMQKDADRDLPVQFTFCLSEHGSYFESKHASNPSIAVPGSVPPQKNLKEEVDDDYALERSLSRVDLDETKNPYRNAKPLPKRFS